MHSDSPFCHNCGIKLAGPFCAACGQKAAPLSVTLHDFFHELTHEILHVDGRIFLSIRRLLLSPGFLTREYVQGRRARWVSPIRLYLISSVAYFALSALAPGGPIQVRATGDDADVAEAVQKLGYRDVGELQQAVTRALVSWIPRAMFVLMPVFAWFVALAHRRADRNYLHHVYFALHVHAAWFALAALSVGVKLASPAIGKGLGFVLFVYGLIYAFRAFRAVYRGTVVQTIARATLVLIAYVLVVSLALAAIVAPVVLGRSWWSRG